MGFTFNGVTSDSIGLKVKNYKKSILPPISVISYDLPNKAGKYFMKNKLDQRSIEIEVYFSGASESDYETKVRNLASWLYTTSPKQLILSEEPDKYYMAILSEETELEQIYIHGIATLRFECLTPFAYSTTQDTVNWATGTSSITINNGGTAETYPTISFTAWDTSALFTNTTVGKKIELQGLTTGQTVVINCDTGVVTVNGTANNSYLTLDSEFFPLNVGNNTITLTSTTHNTVTFTFNKRYL
jgi:predicted phage tail component-like protein